MGPVIRTGTVIAKRAGYKIHIDPPLKGLYEYISILEDSQVLTALNFIFLSPAGLSFSIFPDKYLY
jgi:hypothetical protein